MYIIAMSVKIYKGVKNRRMFMALDGQLSVLYFCALVFRNKGGYVYVLPDIKPLEEVLPRLRAHAGGA